MGKVPPLSFAEAQARLIALAPRLPVEHRAIADCAGFYLAEPLAACRDQPAASVSAMDGYAVRGADLPGPWRVIGESAAGHPFGGSVGAGEAVRISTGAVVPQGADTVVVQEDCFRDGEALGLIENAKVSAGRHIRAKAMDFAAGGALLEAGMRLTPARLALAIAAGHHLLPVHRALRIAVIDSGDELVAAGAVHDPANDFGRLPASNGPMLAAMIAGLPARIDRRGPVPDNIDSLVAALEQAHDADVIVTSGGASVGDHDLIRPALAAIGADIEFWRVAIKPGKPLLVARRGTQLILGLPGNPASAYVTGYLFMLPVLRAALGASAPLPRAISAVLGTTMASGGSRTEFIRGVWDGAKVDPDPMQDSGALSPLARANALIRREAGAPGQPAGSGVVVYLLENGGMA